MMKFQYYPADIRQNKPIDFISLIDFIKKTKTPQEKTKQLFEQIVQAEKNKDWETKHKLKSQLVKFTPCVHINNWRKYENIEKFTGLLVLDFDHLDSSEALELKNALFDSCNFIIACWLSPSKHGIKALVKIPISKDVDEFKSYAKAIINDLGSIKGFDSAPTLNCVQPLYLSYDKDLLYREDFTTYEKKYIEPVKVIFKPLNLVKEPKTETIATIVVNNINTITTTGHYKLRAISYSLGGYISAGYISESDALYIINSCIEMHPYLNAKASTYKKTAQTMIIKGQSEPLYLTQTIVV